jgi:hypothetical protein
LNVEVDREERNKGYAPDRYEREEYGRDRHKMDFFKLCWQILRRDPGVNRDDVLFVTIFGGTFLFIIFLTWLTLVYGDAPTFIERVIGRDFFY